MSLLKMCLNWKVAVGLAAVAGGVYVFAPGLFAAALPVLFLALCPLSMVLMMSAMSGNKGDATRQSQSPAVPGGPTRVDTDGLEAELRRLQAEERDVVEQLATRSGDGRRHAS